jgi:hypothetical protein
MSYILKYASVHTVSLVAEVSQLTTQWRYLCVILRLILSAAHPARDGSSVAISGDCMLVEVDPRYGFLDSDISTYWKTLTSLTGTFNQIDSCTQ